MKVTVCIGSACHVKGSRQVLEQLQSLIAEHGVEDKVEMAGTFCTGNCQKGVCVTIGDTLHSVSPETCKDFFETQILANL
jgi:NADH:ubiquinone oxidoreductase subunit E